MSGSGAPPMPSSRGDSTSESARGSRVPRCVDVPMFIDGQWRAASRTTERRDPYRGDLVARTPVSSAGDVADAVAAAHRARGAAAAIPGFERAAILRRVAARLRERADAIAETMTRETGKAIRDSLAEVQRAPDTVETAAQEAVRIEGEHVPMDGSPVGAGKLALTMRFPVGVVAAITPFNAPINLACHKLAPALAAGNTIVLKPSPGASLVTHRLVEVFVESGVPPGFLNVVYGDDAGPALVRDPRVELVSFTGSTPVGARIRAESALRRVTLELGGNGATIVDQDADLATVAPLCARNAMRLAGQSCVSVQNIYVHERVADDFARRLVDEVRALRVGDPMEPQTDVGTLIDEAAAVRVESWVREATAAGARLLIGGGREGAQMQPTLLANAQPSMRVVSEEVFGPVANLLPVATFDEAIEHVNASPYGLQTGVFTKSLANAMQAARRIRSGAIILNGTSTWRSDQMPYGGVKNSGIGREGPRYAVRDMTEERLVVFNL